MEKYRFFKLDLNVGSEVIHFIVGGRVFHSPADLLKKNFRKLSLQPYFSEKKVNDRKSRKLKEK